MAWSPFRELEMRPSFLGVEFPWGAGSPLLALRDLQDEMNRLVNGRSSAALAPHFPSINVWVAPEEAIVAVQAPGFTHEQLNVSIEGAVLTVAGEPAWKAPQDAAPVSVEFEVKPFRRSLELPFPVEAARVEGQYKHGTLILTLPRAESDKPKKIEIKAQ